MRRRNEVIVASLLALAAGSPAGAATLVSPPLVAAGERVLDCYLVNVGKKSREVTIQVFSREGEVVEYVQTTLDPGKEDVARADAAKSPRYCRFVVDGPRGDFRASILVRDEALGAVSALPAQ